MSLTLSIDPGETVGWAAWLDRDKVNGGQTPWHDFLMDLALELGVDGAQRWPAARMDPFGFEVADDFGRLIVEDFVLYPEGVGDGPPPPWDNLITARVVGAIQVLADLADVEVVYQGADIKDAGRAAAGDEILARPLHENRHQNDATYHGAYYFARNPEAS